MYFFLNYSYRTAQACPIRFCSETTLTKECPVPILWIVSIWLVCATWNFGLYVVGLKLPLIASKHYSPSSTFSSFRDANSSRLPLEVYLNTSKDPSFEFYCSDTNRGSMTCSTFHSLDTKPRALVALRMDHVCMATTFVETPHFYCGNGTFRTLPSMGLNDQKRLYSWSVTSIMVLAVEAVSCPLYNHQKPFFVKFVQNLILKSNVNCGKFTSSKPGGNKSGSDLKLLVLGSMFMSIRIQ